MRFKKSLDHLLLETSENGEHTFKRTLGLWNLIALGVGAIIGAGLFVRTAAAASEHAGPSVTLGFILAAIGCALAGLCYAEFASMIPVSGSAYTYTYATMGEVVAWVVGWDLVLAYSVSSATVAVSWSEYLNKLLEKIWNEHPLRTLPLTFSNFSRWGAGNSQSPSLLYRSDCFLAIDTWN